jgi:hypothetical protein
MVAEDAIFGFYPQATSVCYASSKGNNFVCEKCEGVVLSGRTGKSKINPDNDVRGQTG